jgi:hypothetical protein
MNRFEFGNHAFPSGRLFGPATRLILPSMRTSWIWSLPVAGVFYVAGVVLRGRFADPHAPGDFVARAGAPLFPVSYLLIMVAAALSMLGYIALRDQLRDRLGSAAMVLSVVGLHFLTAFFGVMAITYPAFASAVLEGDSSALAIAIRATSSPVTLVVMGLSSLNVFGHVLFAVALWRTARPLKPAGVLLVLAPIMQLVPWIYPVEILGCVLLCLSGLWIAAGASRAGAAAVLA